METGDTGRSLSMEEGADRLASLFDSPEESERRPQDTAPEADEPEAVEAADDAADDDAEEDAADDEATDEAEQADEEDAEQTMEFSSLDELAQALDKSPDDLMAQLKTTVKVNGTESAVTLAELRAGYQRGRDYSEKTTELKAQREQFDQFASQARQAAEAQILQLGHFVQAAEQFFLQPLDQAQMDQLRATNPGEWTARLQEHQARAGFVQQMKQQAVQALEQHKSLQQRANEVAREEMLASERKKLESQPWWNDQMRSDLLGYLSQSYGYSDTELSQVSDSRIIDLVRKARAFDALQQQSDVAKKKVKPLPKMAPPSKPGGRVDVKRSTLERARARLKQSGSRHDAASLIERML